MCGRIDLTRVNRTQVRQAARDAVAGTVKGEATTARPTPEPAGEPTRAEQMRAKIKAGGHTSPYRLRKQLPEPVFGIIKSVMGFRQFLLRVLDCVRGEWNLVTMAWNIKRMYALSLS